MISYAWSERVWNVVYENWNFNVVWTIATKIGETRALSIQTTSSRTNEPWEPSLPPSCTKIIISNCVNPTRLFHSGSGAAQARNIVATKSAVLRSQARWPSIPRNRRRSSEHRTYSLYVTRAPVSHESLKCDIGRISRSSKARRPPSNPGYKDTFERLPRTNFCLGPLKVNHCDDLYTSIVWNEPPRSIAKVEIGQGLVCFSRLTPLMGEVFKMHNVEVSISWLTLSMTRHAAHFQRWFYNSSKFSSTCHSGSFSQSRLSLFKCANCRWERGALMHKFSTHLLGPWV